MKIDLREIQSYWINLDNETGQATRISKMCDDLELNHERFRAIKKSPGIVGCGYSHISCWHLAKKDLPCLIFEDDASRTDAPFTPIIEVPDECSALYLGISHAGVGTQGGYDSVRASKYNDDFIQLHNMLCLHAVVFINPEYMKRCISVAEDFVYNRDVPIDCAPAELHKEFLILTPNEPLFYQADPEQKAKFPVEHYTKPPLNVNTLLDPPPNMVYNSKDMLGRTL
jgi:hypothetical protein